MPAERVGGHPDRIAKRAFRLRVVCVGYHHHDAEDVHLYRAESFSFRVATPEAAVALVPA